MNYNGVMPPDPRAESRREHNGRKTKLRPPVDVSEGSDGMTVVTPYRRSQGRPSRTPQDWRTPRFDVVDLSVDGDQVE